jgi:hypothetical protein
MKQFSLSKAVAIAVALCGFAWILMCATGLVPVLVGAEDASTKAVVFILTPAMVIPGIFAVKFGCRLYGATTKRDIKRAVGMLVVFGVFSALLLFPERPNDYGLSPDLLLLTLIAILLYVSLSRLLMSQAGLVPAKGEFIGKGTVLLVSVQIYTLSSKVAEPYLSDATHEPKAGFYDSDLMFGIMTLGPLCAAIVFYKLSMRFIKKRKPGSFRLPDVEGEVTSH